jgi:hypothetical protein
MCVSGIIALACYCYFSSFTFAENGNEPFFPVDSSPYNQTYKYWTQKWWEWNLALDKAVHPINNYTPEKCKIGQKGPVWFLVQPSPEKEKTFEKTCIIPYGKAIITATQSGDCNYGDLKARDQPQTDEKLLDCAQRGNDNTVLKVTVDNKTYNSYEAGRRVLSDFFNVNITKGNIMDYNNTGIYRAVVDGYYIFLKPLEPGKHTLLYDFDTKNSRVNSHQHGNWTLLINKPQDTSNVTG